MEKKSIILATLMVYTTAFFAQDIAQKINNDSSEVPFAVIEQVPVYKGCSKKLSNVQQRTCMSNKITKHFVKNFDIYVAKDLGLPDGKVRMQVIFKINKEGNVIDIKANGPHPNLEKEAYRVVKMIPKLKAPGYQRGKAVTVPYFLPLIFNIDNSKYNAKRK